MIGGLVLIWLVARWSVVGDLVEDLSVSHWSVIDGSVLIWSVGLWSVVGELVEDLSVGRWSVVRGPWFCNTP